MRTTLHNATLVEHVDYICLLDCAEPVCYGDRGSALRSCIESCLDDFLGFTVKRRSGFVEKENLGIAEEGPCNRNTLLLTTAEECTFRTAESLEAFPVRVLAVDLASPNERYVYLR